MMRLTTGLVVASALVGVACSGTSTGSASPSPSTDGGAASNRDASASSVDGGTISDAGAKGGATGDGGPGSTLLSVLVMLCTAACSTSTDALSGATPPDEVPPETPDDRVLDPLEDRNPDEGILEVDLEAKPSTKAFGEAPPTPLWTYNGTVLGPLVDAKVGTRLRVHFQNSLPESTTIHWHGIRLPAAMDGSLATQRPIAPGERFEYEFTLKDPGLYWFHPHQRSDVQVNRGLYGVIRVRGEFEPAADQERVLVLDD